MWQNLLLVGVGGFAGTLARYGVGKLVKHFWHTGFPAATFAVNILGSFILGFLLAACGSDNESRNKIKLLAAVGFCGGFTSFSSFAYENLDALQSGEFLKSITYTGASLIFGLFAVWGGFLLGKQV